MLATKQAQWWCSFESKFDVVQRFLPCDARQQRRARPTHQGNEVKRRRVASHSKACEYAPPTASA